jgi:phage/plasmid-like protein (TIGR03299 family)
MGHNIHINKDGVASFFTVKELAWHTLGTVLEDAPNTEKAIVVSGMNFTVAKAPISAAVMFITREKANELTSTVIKNTREISKSEFISEYSLGVAIPNRMATYRTDTNEVFGIVSDDYVITQNIEAFNFFDSVVGEGGAIYETGGCLGKGETVFLTAKLKDCIEVGDDKIDQYLLFTTSHDGSSSIRVMYTPVRVVCNNTLQMALEGQSKHHILIKHSSKAKDKLEAAAELMALTGELSQKFGKVFTTMSQFKMTDEQLQDYIARCVLPEQVYKLTKDDPIVAEKIISTKTMNVIEGMYYYAIHGPGQDTKECKGTLYGAFNGVTGFYQNVKEYSSEDYKFLSLYATDGMKKRQRAYEIANLLLTNKY